MASPLAGKYRVGKSFEHEGNRLESGAIVEVAGWPNARKLVTYRYLVPLAAAPAIAGAAPQVAASTREDAACPKCDATGDAPCVSKSGRATVRHTTRVEPGA